MQKRICDDCSIQFNEADLVYLEDEDVWRCKNCFVAFLITNFELDGCDEFEAREKAMEFIQNIIKE